MSCNFSIIRGFVLDPQGFAPEVLLFLLLGLPTLLDFVALVRFPPALLLKLISLFVLDSGEIASMTFSL